MKFYPLTGVQDNTDPKALASEYEAAREIGRLRLGELRLYFKQARKVYYIPYSAVRRCFRRVQLVQAKLCCGKGNLEIENLVICGEEGELAQVQLPGTKAAKVLMAELERLIPEAEFGKPADAPAETAGDSPGKL
ncbi:MAG: hypothetical protein LUE22_03180 [Oscillospiraceae bacterium]|nr:hypothetical protein [Oscillospiraceae bacterium]